MALDKGDGLEHILDIAMAPVLALDGGDGCDICIALALALALVPVCSEIPNIEIKHILPAPKAWTCVGRMRMRLKMSRALKPAVPAMVRCRI